ncbi:intein C-terminal splicing region/RHS repeat-associated core domain-containing protein [Singulisphaera sp. GP187]|uniref:polymorphic toxin-type HINT domain-containing protein n=1 Tax=Singulisphaera sp. GP187 TaxID=1882752 RepID=UPI00092A5821|nr:polymorphic toxin-type HINT domain-containing protein [Singulisphaera sp. GP187]SIO67996.1 intein C-terminal splicing region/RHS repeat-associated core domain-containing protein [Singulisphaera sp. GP187]
MTVDKLDGATLSQPLVTTYTYDLDDRLVSTAMPNGTVETRGYDVLNHLTSIVTTLGASGPVLAGFTYTLDKNGLRRSMTEASGRTVAYTYDADGRLVKEAITHDPSATDRTFGYAYDLAGNRSSLTDTGDGTGASDLRSYYDTDNRLMEVYGISKGGGYTATYSYDGNGDTKTETVTTDNGTGNTTTSQTTYAWDLEGRLISANVPDANGTTHHTDYLYDDDGNRVTATTDGQRTTYLNDPNQAYDQVLEEYAPGGALVASYVRGLDLLFQDRNGTRSFYVKDGLGSTRKLTDATGVVTDTTKYDAYGITLAHTGTTVNAYQFAGEQRDAATGLDYLRARYYDASAGRFTSRDSYDGEVADPVTQNHYSYAGGNPVDFVDASGHEFTLSGITVSIGVQTTIRSVGTGAVLGAIGGATYGGIDAALGGDDWQQAALRGAVSGFILGAAGGALGSQWGLLTHAAHYTIKTALFGFNVISTGAGIIESLFNGELDQAGFRLFAGLGGFGLIRRIPTCFPAGTKVLTVANGSHGHHPGFDVQYKNIEDVVVGDTVLCAEETHVDRSALGRVAKVYRRQAKSLLVIRVGGIDKLQQTLTPTPEHPFWVDGKGWLAARSLMEGDRLRTSGDSLCTVMSIRHQDLESDIIVYNLEVADNHCYYVADREGVDGILVHNADYGTLLKGMKSALSSGKPHYNENADSLDDALNAVKNFLGSDAIEAPPGVPDSAGNPGVYVDPAFGTKKWFRIEPPDGGSNMFHIKFQDYTGGKRGRGGINGHITFPEADYWRYVELLTKPG